MSELLKRTALEIRRGRREGRVPARTHGPRATKSTRQNHRYRRIIRPSLRNGFNGVLRALLGDHAWLPPSPVRRESVFTTLAPASERQDHTTSPYVAASFVCAMNAPDAAASIASRAQRP